MSVTDIPLHLDVSAQPFPVKNNPVSSSSSNEVVINRRRSNSQSQVIQIPSTQSSRQKEHPTRRNQFQYSVTLTPLNDTFIKKQLTVPYFPETRKLGRPAGAKIKPDITNGYFDSRVLSRNHAAMFIDPTNGKLMLKDLGSSNGTYVNEERIGSEPVEIKIGDIIYLGFNIQVDTNHKQISAKVENINVISNFLKSTNQNYPVKNQDSPEFKHMNFVQELLGQLPNSSVSKRSNKESNDELSFDSALFGDINPNLEDSLLGLYNKDNTGIFNNSRITNAYNLESIINILASCLTKVKQQNNTLITLEQFLNNYQQRLNEINSNYLEQELEKKVTKYEDEIYRERINTQGIRNEFKHYKDESMIKIDSLNRKLKESENDKKSLYDEIRYLYTSTNDIKSQKINNDNNNEVYDSNDLVESNINVTAKYKSSDNKTNDVIGHNVLNSFGDINEIRLTNDLNEQKSPSPAPEIDILEKNALNFKSNDKRNSIDVSFQRVDKSDKNNCYSSTNLGHHPASMSSDNQSIQHDSNTHELTPPVSDNEDSKKETDELKEIVDSTKSFADSQLKDSNGRTNEEILSPSSLSPSTTLNNQATISTDGPNFKSQGIAIGLSVVIIGFILQRLTN